MIIKSINPYTEEVNGEIELYDSKKAVAMLKNASIAYEKWNKLDIKERSEYFYRLAKILRDNKRRYGETITKEMGKPITQAIAEIEKCAWCAEFYAEKAENWLKDEYVKMEAKKSFIAFQGIGVIFSIMPWNYPFWQVFRFAVPSLIAGNTTIVKVSNSVPFSGLAIEEAFEMAGFPENVFKIVLVTHDIAEGLIKKKEVRGVSFTGSSSAGKRIAKIATSHLKKVVLELGGSDPMIILKDADVKYSCENAVKGRTVSTGQSCIATKRIILAKELENSFTENFILLMKNLKIGDPMDPYVDIGPLANAEQVKLINAFLNDALGKGAILKTGGKRVGSKGFIFEPTVLTNIKRNMKLWKEEVFGPIAPIMIAKDENEAIKMANSSLYGLGASIWTKNEKLGEKLAREIEAGIVYINDYVKSDPRIPFGGVKESGFGRELSRYGLLEFTNIKSIVIK